LTSTGLKGFLFTTSAKPC